MYVCMYIYCIHTHNVTIKEDNSRQSSLSQITDTNPIKLSQKCLNSAYHHLPRSRLFNFVHACAQELFTPCVELHATPTRHSKNACNT